MPSHPVLAVHVFLLATLGVSTLASAQPAQPSTGASSAGESHASHSGNDVDLFMKRALDNRASWQRLGDFILCETVDLELETPSGIPRFSLQHEYQWYVRNGVAVRSPVRFDGVDIDEDQRRDFEADWLREEARRRTQHDHLPEPRFIADTYYFAEFQYELGSSYIVGREIVAGREVVRVEFYPADHLDDEADQPLNRGFNKTSLVTFWIDPEVHQIVQYTFDNPGLDFLRLRWLLRVDGLEALVEMTPVGDVWMPARVTTRGRVTTALGEFQLKLTRELFDYREAETGARFIGPGSPR